jgi:DNA-directed RNA polymerase specialized sigma24 family protein
MLTHIIWTIIRYKFDKSKNDSSNGTLTSFSTYGTNLLKEEVNDWWRQNDESTSPKGSIFYSTFHQCFVANESDSESEDEEESENESEDEDDDDLRQLYAHLSKKDKMIMLKLMKRA